MLDIDPRAVDPLLVNRCLTGEIFVVRRFLQNAGAYELARGSIISAAGAVNRTTARQIESEGFDKLHNLFSIHELIRLVRLSDHNLSKVVRKLYRKLLRSGLAFNRAIWVLRRPIIRIHIPHTGDPSHQKLLQQFRKTYGEGRLTTLRPHRDGWFEQPSTCINVWIPLSTIVHGNGLSIFPEDYRKSLNYEKFLGVTRSQAVTRPLNVTMGAGDALFFHADHLHASELNHSDTTRAVLSLRLVAVDPDSTLSPPRYYCLVNPKLPISLCWLLDSDKLRISKAIRQRVQKLVLRYAGLNNPTIKPVRPMLQSQDVAVEQPTAFCPHRLNRPAGVDMVTGVPLAISNQHALVKIDQKGEQQIWKFDRRCPHEGADLALGYIDDHHIHCPWHNLPIDIKTGRSACKSIGYIKTHRCM